MLRLDDSHSGDDEQQMAPYNPVQQNVAAWALFGMFFTALPIAGSLLETTVEPITGLLDEQTISTR